MIVFLRKVPPDVSLEEILEFLEPALRGGLFRPAGEVVSVNLLEIRAFNSGLEYHAVAHIKPDEVGERVIKKLHLKIFRGRRIALHEYVVRNWRNERRMSQPNRGELKIDRRQLSTRRRVVSIEVKPLG